MKKIFSLLVLSVLTLTASADTTWDFSKVPATDIDNLAADKENWLYDEANERYANTMAYIPNNSELVANGKVIEATKGLLFTVPKANADRVRFSLKSSYQVMILNADGISIKIPNLTKGQRIEVVAKTGKSSEAHGFSATNVTADEGSFVNSLDKLTNTGTVTENGDVTLTAVGSMVIYSISVIGDSAPIEYTTNAKWDFSNVGDTDLAALNADTENWEWDAANERYKNTANFMPNNEQLVAGGNILNVTKGVIFKVVKADRIRISTKSTNKILQLNGDALSLVVKNVKAGQEIHIVAKTGTSSDARGITASNVEPVKGFTKSTDKIENVGIVKTDGDVVITTDGGAMSFSSIEICDASSTGITSATAITNNNKVYTISGTETSAATKGILIKNGKKIIRK